MRSHPVADGSILVHVWSGNQFLPKDIEIQAIRQFSDNQISSGTQLPPEIESLIETTHSVLFAKETLEHLCAQLYAHLFNPPPMHRLGRCPVVR